MLGLLILHAIIFIWHLHVSTYTEISFKTFLFVQCSTSCGGGKRKRNVKCIAVKTGLPSTQCTLANKPNTYEECNNKTCPSEKTGKLSTLNDDIFNLIDLFEKWLNQ